MLVSVRGLGYSFYVCYVVLFLRMDVCADLVHKPLHRGRLLEHKRLEVRESTLTRQHTHIPAHTHTRTHTHTHTHFLSHTHTHPHTHTYTRTRFIAEFVISIVYLLQLFESNEMILEGMHTSEGT